MKYSSLVKVSAAMWVMAIVGIGVKEIQEENMKTLLVPIEVTDAQYLALDKVAKDNAHDEAQLVASAAVTAHANRVLDAIEKKTMAADPQETRYDEPGLVNVQELISEQQGHVETGGRLTASGGVFMGPSGKETWYNLPMEVVISMMRGLGYSEEEYPFWIREDNVKMFGRFVMVAADTNVRPKGTILDTSLGEGIVVDHCVRAETEPGIDIAVMW